jgi:hypothetical protein
MTSFELLEETFRTQGADAALDRLVRTALDDRNYRELFSARLLQARHRLGLPLVETESTTQLTDEQRPVYEKAMQDAARETGGLFLADGDIASAWPYFRAIGEPAPVAAAIEKIEEGEELERIIEIAYHEGVNPRKGLELALKQFGICRAITWFGGNRDFESRQQCLVLLVDTLYRELASSLKQTIAANEPAEPATGSVAELITGRDWLFEGNSYYVDSSHLISILRYSPELEDPRYIRMCLEMAEYGDKLSEMFHFRGDFPFEDPYRDHAIYLRALLQEQGEHVDAAIEHFRSKAAAPEYPGDTSAAEVLIGLLVRLDRHDAAIRASLEFLPEPQPSPTSCPSALQLCQLAGDYRQMRELARSLNDRVSFVAGVVQCQKSTTP